MNLDIKEWLAIGSLITVFFGGAAWIYKRIKKLIEFLKEIDDNKENVELNRKMILFNAAKLDSIIILMHDAIFVCNEEGLCITCSDSLCELFGSSREKMMGSGWINYIISEDRPSAWGEWMRNVKDGSKDMVGSYRIQHGITGKIIPIIYHAILPRVENTKELIISVGKAKQI